MPYNIWIDMKKWTFALLVPVLAGLAACRPSPCVTCQVWRFRGQRIEDYLHKAPRPDKVLEAPDGSRTYLFLQARTDTTLIPGANPLPEAKPEAPSDPISAIVLGLLRGLMGQREKEGPRPMASNRVETAYVITVKADPAGRIVDASCEKLSVSLRTVSLR